MKTIKQLKEERADINAKLFSNAQAINDAQAKFVKESKKLDDLYKKLDNHLITKSTFELERTIIKTNIKAIEG